MPLLRLLAARAPFALAGCISYTTTAPAQSGANTPASTGTTCANGTQPPLLRLARRPGLV